MNYEVRTAAGHTSLKLRAAGIETESPKCDGPDDYRDVDGLVVNSPAAAQQDLLLRTFYLMLLEKQTTTKYYSHV